MFDVSEPPLTSFDSPYGGSLVFAHVCPSCGRFVKADPVLLFKESADGIYSFEPNGTCARHGRIDMPFIGDM